MKYGQLIEYNAWFTLPCISICFIKYRCAIAVVLRMKQEWGKHFTLKQEFNQFWEAMIKKAERKAQKRDHFEWDKFIDNGKKVV